MARANKYLEQKIGDAALLVESRREAFLNNPQDPETNHKLRVSIRTLRSLVDFISPWQKRKQNARVQKNLKHVVRRTSRLRELDVLCELVNESGNASQELVQFCEQCAARERDEVLQAISSEEYAAKLHDAVRSLGKLRWKKPVAKKGLRNKQVRKRYDALVDSLRADLETLDENDYETVHDVRKRAKQVRYVSEQFPEVLGPDAAEAARSTKAQQDRLGAICDARVNRELVQVFIAEENLSPNLAQELRDIVGA